MKPPTISDQIRALHQSGASIAEIAAKLGIRYQHAYNVVGKRQGRGATTSPNHSVVARPPVKPLLTVDMLQERGFITAGYWQGDGARLICPKNLPRCSGVYAFSVGETVRYVGLASRSLAQRLYFYGNPGPSQRTNIRVNAIIHEAMKKDSAVVEVHYACPPSFEWNGFMISGAEGLEAGLIQSYHLVWNVRGAQPSRGARHDRDGKLCGSQ